MDGYSPSSKRSGTQTVSGYTTLRVSHQGETPYEIRWSVIDNLTVRVDGDICRNQCVFSMNSLPTETSFTTDLITLRIIKWFVLLSTIVSTLQWVSQKKDLLGVVRCSLSIL